MEFLSNFQC